MIVVDCTTLAYLLLPCQYTPAVEKLLLKHPVWASVSLWEAEFASVLWKTEKFQKLDRQRSIEIVGHAHRLLGHTSFNIPILRALEVARRTNCSSYDSYYIALAEDLGTTLYTYDKEILKNCPNIAVQP